MTEFTLEEWRNKGKELYGEDPMKWKFRCPVCDHVATVQDWKDAGAPVNSAGFSCVGRWAGANKETEEGDLGPNGKKGKGPCNYAGGGLFKLNPVTVIDPDGHKMNCFAFADA
jgi:hypothetical protein